MPPKARHRAGGSSRIVSGRRSRSRSPSPRRSRRSPSRGRRRTPQRLLENNARADLDPGWDPEPEWGGQQRRTTATLAFRPSPRGRSPVRDVGAATAARAARCNPPLSIGARVLMEDDVQGGKIVECQVARYEGEAVAFHFPDGSRCRVGESVEEAAARAQNAQDKWAADQFGRQVRIQSRTVGGAVDATIVSFRDGLFTVQYYTANGHSRDKDIPLMKLRSLLGMSLRDPTSPPRGAREGKYSPLVGGRGARSPEALEPAEYYSPDTVQGQGVMDRQAHMRAGMEVARRHRGSPRARSPRQPDPTAAWVENHPVEGYEAESPGSTRVTRLERQLIRENEDLKRELQRLAAGDRHSRVYPTDGRPMGGPTSPRLPQPRPDYAEHYTAELLVHFGPAGLSQ